MKSLQQDFVIRVDRAYQTAEDCKQLGSAA